MTRPGVFALGEPLEAHGALKDFTQILQELVFDQLHPVLPALNPFQVRAPGCVGSLSVPWG